MPSRSEAHCTQQHAESLLMQSIHRTHEAPKYTGRSRISVTVKRFPLIVDVRARVKHTSGEQRVIERCAGDDNVQRPTAGTLPNDSTAVSKLHPSNVDVSQCAVMRDQHRRLHAPS
ncbi:hypothetical protein TcBrA4_0126050 [Trypanosoma cruzi]|nr:hypothetical protein TcBrA4_0126050 [Trypanosoma cruzi]